MGDDWDTDEWGALPLIEKDVELLAHMSIRDDATHTERLQDLWPHKCPEETAALMSAAVDRISAIAPDVTGRPGSVIHRGRATGELPSPTIRVRVLGTPRVEARLDD